MEETGVDENALSNEKVPVEAEDVLELPKGERKRVRLTVGVSPEEGREKKKSVKKKEEKKGDGVSGDVEGVQQVSHLRRNVVEMGKDEMEIRWDPGDFEMEHMTMEVAPRWNTMEGWFKKDVVQPMAAWAEFTPYLASVAVMGPFEQSGGVCGSCQGPTPTPTVVVFADGGGRQDDQGVLGLGSVRFFCQLGCCAGVGVAAIPVVAAVDGASG